MQQVKVACVGRPKLFALIFTESGYNSILRNEAFMTSAPPLCIHVLTRIVRLSIQQKSPLNPNSIDSEFKGIETYAKYGS